MHSAFTAEAPAPPWLEYRAVVLTAMVIFTVDLLNKGISMVPALAMVTATTAGAGWIGHRLTRPMPAAPGLSAAIVVAILIVIVCFPATGLPPLAVSAAVLSGGFGVSEIVSRLIRPALLDRPGLTC